MCICVPKFEKLIVRCVGLGLLTLLVVAGNSSQKLRDKSKHKNRQRFNFKAVQHNVGLYYFVHSCICTKAPQKHLLCHIGTGWFWFDPQETSLNIKLQIL